jgi:hypothetical protein
MRTHSTVLEPEPSLRQRARRAAAADRRPAAGVLALQQSAGNRAVAQLLAQAGRTFDTDLSRTPVVTGSPEARALGVHAFTRAGGIHVAGSAAHLEGPAGRQLLGHELAHVVQQRQGRASGSVQARGLSVDPSMALEVEAERAGASFAAGIRADGALRTDPAAQLPGGDVTQMQLGWLWALVQQNPWLTAIGATAAVGIATWAYLQPQPKSLLNELPESLWWRLFIDKKHQAGGLTAYDKDQSPGYSASMMAAFKQELASESGPGKPIDMTAYTRLHDLVTSRLETEDNVRGLSSRDFGSKGEPPVSFPIAGKGKPAADIIDEKLNGVLLIRLFVEGTELGDGSRAICEFAAGRFYVLYPESEGSDFAEAALTRYYAEILKAQGETAKLTAIVKAIRALHVIHVFRDANGRLNIFVLLNKLLLQQGFRPVILPNGPEVFGGSYTIPELVLEVEAGMKAFGAAVTTAKQPAQTAQKQPALGLTS